MPPMRHAEMPVEAVITRLSGGNDEMILLKRYDFPLPAAPVKKTFLPLRHATSELYFSNVFVQKMRIFSKKYVNFILIKKLFESPSLSR